MTPQKVNIDQKLSQFADHWNPRIVGELNGEHVKLVKFRGEFVWHKHDHEDEMFLVVRGAFRMELRGGTVSLAAGDLWFNKCTIPLSSIEHQNSLLCESPNLN